MNDARKERLRVARLLTRHIEPAGLPRPTPMDLLSPSPEQATVHWIWTGAFRPREPQDAFDKYRINLIRLPRPTTLVAGGKERHPVKPLMAIQCDDPTDEPSFIRQRCADKRCVNPHHWSATRATEELRRKFP